MSSGPLTRSDLIRVAEECERVKYSLLEAEGRLRGLYAVVDALADRIRVAERALAATAAAQ